MRVREAAVTLAGREQRGRGSDSAAAAGREQRGREVLLGGWL